MILRRLRGIAGTALLWAVPWSLILGAVVAITVTFLRVYLSPLQAFGQGALTGFTWGLAAGALFGSALMLGEQGRGLAQLTRTRSALWGALAGIWFPALIGIAFGPSTLPWMIAGWPAYLVTAAMGAFSGVATVWLAGKGPGLLDRPSSTEDRLAAAAPLNDRSAPSGPGALSQPVRRPTHSD